MGEANAGWGCGVAVALCLAESRAERRAGSQVQSFPTSLRRCGQKSMQLRQKYRCARSKRQVWGGAQGGGGFCSLMNRLACSMRGRTGHCLAPANDKRGRGSQERKTFRAGHFLVRQKRTCSLPPTRGPPVNSNQSRESPPVNSSLHFIWINCVQLPT